MMQMPLQRLLFDKGNGNGHDWTPTQNEVQEMFSQVTNAYFVREGILSKWMDPRRDYDKECGYPETTQITAEIFRRIYERDPIGRRVVRFLPEECWQKPPDVFEDDDPNVLTEFEAAWQDLSRSMRTPSGETWYAGQEGSAIWEAMIRLDVLSRIGQYGVMLLGFDDGQDLSLPVRGVEEEGSVPVLQEFNDKGEPRLVQNERGLKVPKLSWPLGTWEQAGCPAYGLTVNAEGATTSEGQKAGLKYLRVFPEDLAQVVQWEVNQNSPRYGHPAMYMINQSDPYVGVSGVGQNMASMRVHWTRVIHVADNRDSSDTNGSPSCRPVYNRLLDLTKLYGGSAEMYWAGAFPGISAETHPQLGGDVAIDKTEFRAQMKNWYNTLQRWLGMSGMSFKMLSPTVVNPKNQIDVQLQAICVLLGVPLRIFMGSERGELASNMDDTTWTDRVRFRLHSHLTPHLIVPFIDRLIWLKVLPEPRQKRKDEKNARPGYQVVWPDLKVLSPQQKATVAQLITQCLAAYVGTPGLIDLIEPLTYLTKVVGWDEKEARAYIEATLEEMKARNPDVDEADLHVGVPPQPPMDEFGMGGEGGGFPPEAGGWPPEEEPTTQEAVDNANPKGCNQYKPCSAGKGAYTGPEKYEHSMGMSGNHFIVRTNQHPVAKGRALFVVVAQGQQAREGIPHETLQDARRAMKDNGFTLAHQPKEEAVDNAFCKTGKGGGRDPIDNTFFSVCRRDDKGRCEAARTDSAGRRIFKPNLSGDDPEPGVTESPRRIKGEVTSDWAAKNIGRKLGRAAGRLIEDYTTQGFTDLNSALRDGSVGKSDTVEVPDSKGGSRTVGLRDMMTALDSAMAPSPRAITLFRGSDWASLRTTKVGAMVSDPAYVSTTVDRTVASGGQFGEDLLVIECPKGSRMASVGQNSKVAGEGEVILARGSSFRVIDRKPRPGGGSYIRLRLDQSYRGKKKLMTQEAVDNDLYGEDEWGSWEPAQWTQVIGQVVANADGRPRILNRPFRTPGGPKKFGVYVKGPKGTTVLVRFGDPDMEIKRDDPGRRKNFRARHSCDDDPGPRWKARYWACKTWEKGKTVDEVVNQDPTDNTFFSECERDDEGRCKKGGGSSRSATSGRGPRASKPPEATAKRPTSTRGASKGRSRARGTGRETAKGTAGCAKCDRAKQAHVMIAKGDQARAEKNERQVAKIVGGLTFKDSEPADVVIGKENQVTGGVEVKSILKGKNDKITMDSYAQVRKLDWEKRNKATFHTVIVDDRNPKARKLYYRRGVAGSARLGNLHLVKNAAELKALVVADEKSLPEKARRTDQKMRTGSWKPIKGERAFKNTKTGKVVRAKK